MMRYLLKLMRRFFFQPRVFRDEIGPWPKVYRTEQGYRIKAVYASPDWVSRARRVAMFPTAVAMVMIAPFLMAMGSGMGEYGFFIGLLFCLLCALALHSFFTWDVGLTKVKTNIHFRNGWIRWRGGRIAPGDNREFGVDHHRLGPAEARKFTEMMRRKNLTKDPVPNYQTASEVVLRTGFANQNRKAVAAIRDDEHGEKGSILRAAIEFVDEKAIELAANEAAERAAEKLLRRQRA